MQPKYNLSRLNEKINKTDYINPSGLSNEQVTII